MEKEYGYNLISTGEDDYRNKLSVIKDICEIPEDLINSIKGSIDDLDSKWKNTGKFIVIDGYNTGIYGKPSVVFHLFNEDSPYCFEVDIKIKAFK